MTSTTSAPSASPGQDVTVPADAVPAGTVPADAARDRLLAQVLVEFAHTLGTDFSIQKILDHLVLRIVEILPITGAGVMLMGERDHLHFVAASNEPVLRIEVLQNELDEGPCLQAFRTGQPVAVTDLAVDEQFPRFSPRARADGLAAVFTFPLRLDHQRLGALDLYRDAPGALSPGDLQAAQVLADVAAAYLFNAQARIDASATVARLHHRSLHDPLTGLPNRMLLEELLDQAVSRARRSGHVAAVMFLDLDGFKSVNDRFGHHVGDRLLTAVAGRLTSALRPGDTLARLGGDEFVVLCEDLPDVGHAEAVAARITSAVAAPFDLAGHRPRVTASVGVAFSGPGMDIPQALLRGADFAMYQAKARGGAQHQVLDPSARLAADRREDLERALRDAQQHDELSVRYQPVVEVGSGRLAAVEALLRWRHPDLGWVSPEIVIPSAERTGLILTIGEWVLTRACRDLAGWQAAGLDVPSVAVNVSAHQLMGAAFVETVARVLSATGVPASSLCLEVTESVFLADAPRALSVLGAVRDLGVTLSLDDFGTGYSSLSYLRRFPFQNVKIDRSFTADVLGDEATRHVVAAMVALCHALDLRVVAEGVETTEQLTAMSGLGADHVQGFLVGRPMTARDLAEHVRSPDPRAGAPGC